jgi:large subunit ribosomal protein L22
VTGPKLNEAPVRVSGRRRVRVKEETPSFRARGRYLRVSPYKVREVLDLIRGLDAERARETLQLSDRDAATVVDKVLASAMANGENHHEHPVAADELYVSACYADEGPTLKRWRPRARGRATRIRKRTCHVTVIVSRFPEDELRERRARQPGAADRRRRTAASRRPRKQAAAPVEETTPVEEEATTEDAVVDETVEQEAVEETPAADVATEPEAIEEPAVDEEEKSE